MSSWVIVDKASGRAMLETFEQTTANRVREQHQDTHEVVPIQDWLTRLNKQQNTRLGLLYRDAGNYKKTLTVVLAGAITEAQLAVVRSRLEEGRYCIAHQVGLPTPAEQNIGKDDWPNDDLDHVYTELANLTEPVEAHMLHTSEPPTLELSVDEWVEDMAAVEYWDVAEETARQREFARRATRPAGPVP